MWDRNQGPEEMGAMLREDRVLVRAPKFLYQATPEHSVHCDEEPFWTRKLRSAPRPDRASR